MRCHYTPIRIAKIKNCDNIKCCKDVEKLDQSYTAGGNVKWYGFSGNKCDDFLQK